MAYGAEPAARVRTLVSGRAGVTERRMFGGIAWMVGEIATAEDRDLARWVDAGADYAASLPPK